MEDIKVNRPADLLKLINQKLTSETGLWSVLNKFDGTADYCVIISASDMYSRAITKTVWIADVEDQQALTASLISVKSCACLWLWFTCVSKLPMDK